MNGRSMSISELRRVSDRQSAWTRDETIEILGAAPLLLEIASAALVRRAAECSCGAQLGCFPDCAREMAEARLLSALDRVRP